MKKLLQTPFGELNYELERKRVRNLNLRVRADASVFVSAPLRMPAQEIDAFLIKKASWIFEKKTDCQNSQAPNPCSLTKEECFAMFTKVSEQIYPLFADLLHEKPKLVVREMKSRWGSCHIQKKKITLNTRLAEQPAELIEYVVLHEYVHFLHPNHGPNFHAEMAKLMPDYRERRRKLRG